MGESPGPSTAAYAFQEILRPISQEISQKSKISSFYNALFLWMTILAHFLEMGKES